MATALPDMDEIAKRDIVKRILTPFGNVNASTTATNFFTDSQYDIKNLKHFKLAGIFDFLDSSVFHPRFLNSIDQTLMKKGYTRSEIGSLNEEEKFLQAEKAVDLSG